VGIEVVSKAQTSKAFVELSQYRGNTMSEQSLEQRLSTDRTGSVEERIVEGGDKALQERDYAYYKEVFESRQMPFAYVDMDLLAENVRQVVARAGGKNVRLASKSIRSVAIIKHLLAAESSFQGIMCFSGQEAVYLSQQGLRDLLMGYPIYNKKDVVDVVLACRAGADITLMIDSVEHVQQIERIAKEYGQQMTVCLEIDMSIDVPGLHFGVWRSPVRTVEQARPVLDAIEQCAYVQLTGVMGYESQIAGVGDRLPGNAVKNRIVRALKRRSIPEVARRRAEVVNEIKARGMELRFVNGGGTGSLASTREEEVVSEITVGSGFYAPVLFDYYKDFRYRPAAGYAIEIVRKPGVGRYTCLGGGYVASGAVGPEKQPQPYLPQGAKLEALEGAGEVQTPVCYSGSVKLGLGDPIFMRHSKAGELCERFKSLLLVSEGKIIDEVSTYRGDGQCFL
jgi:D-serine deaminase-like pyridoxal phosphate-dependent protein